MPAHQVDIKDLGPVTKPGSGRRSGPVAAGFLAWQSETAAQVAAAKAVELADESEQQLATSQPAAAEAAAGQQTIDPATVYRRVKRKKLSAIAA